MFMRGHSRNPEAVRLPYGVHGLQAAGSADQETRTVVPLPGWETISKVPPVISVLSRMPIRPRLLPVARDIAASQSKPLPSSDTVNSIVPFFEVFSIRDIPEIDR